MFSFPTLLSITFDGEGFLFFFFDLFFQASAFSCAVCASCFLYLKQSGLRDLCPGPGVSLAGSLRRLRQERWGGREPTWPSSAIGCVPPRQPRPLTTQDQLASSAVHSPPLCSPGNDRHINNLPSTQTPAHKSQGPQGEEQAGLTPKRHR